MCCITTNCGFEIANILSFLTARKVRELVIALNFPNRNLLDSHSNGKNYPEYKTKVLTSALCLVF
jgi:hypothetical protein